MYDFLSILKTTTNINSGSAFTHLSQHSAMVEQCGNKGFLLIIRQVIFLCGLLYYWRYLFIVYVAYVRKQVMFYLPVQPTYEP